MSTAKYLVVGLTHIDLAWKMDTEEHRELMEAAVLRLVDVLDRDPEYTYLIEQAAHYRLLNERRPDLIARLRGHIQRGRLEFVGGLASTLETNGPSGESFVRNQLLGLGMVEDLFGKAPRIGYLIDTFGVNAQVPQILRQFGMQRLLANRFGGNRSRDVFVARGLDGSRVLVAGRDANSPYVAPERVFFQMGRNHRHIKELFEKAAATTMQGPCLVMPYTEYEGIARTIVRTLVDERNAADGAGTWAFATLEEFFDALPGLDAGWPEYGSDLNPEFTGTFGLRPGLRLLHRKAENLLIEADKWAALLGVGDAGKARDAWWKMAFAQSHDVYTGSHPTVVYDETIAQLEQVVQHSDAVMRDAAAKLAKPATGDDTTLIAFNGLPWQRDVVVAFGLSGQQSMSPIVAVMDDAGAELPFAVEGDVLKFRATFPGISARRISLRRAPAGSTKANGPARPAEISGSAVTIANEFVTLTADAANGLRVFPAGAAGDDSRAISVNLTLQEDRGNFQIEDLKGAEIPANARPIDVLAPSSTAISQQLTLRGSFPAVWTGSPNPLEWVLECTIYPGKPQVELTVKLDWRGETSRVRLRVETPLETSTGIFEVPFGAVRRTPYHSRRTARGEWPTHRWVAIEEDGAGVALINTGTVGAEVAGGTIWATLLRAPTGEYAGMVVDDTSSQHGPHTYSFALLPYAGSWSDGPVVELGQDVNLPVYCAPVESGPIAAGPLVELSPSTVVLSGIKRPEDGAAGEMVVRVYEATGKATNASLRVPGAVRACKSDMRETRGEPIDCPNGAIALDLAPFEIATIRILRQ